MIYNVTNNSKNPSNIRTNSKTCCTDTIDQKGAASFLVILTCRHSNTKLLIRYICEETVFSRKLHNTKGLTLAVMFINLTALLSPTQTSTRTNDFLCLLLRYNIFLHLLALLGFFTLRIHIPDNQTR